MNFLQDWAILIVPVLAGFITQIIKLATDQMRGNFTMHDILTSYGGMPSSHTSFVVSLTTIIGLTQGIKSAAFAIAAILMLIVIRDAMGFRLILGEQSKVLNYLADKLPAEEKKKLPLLTEQLGHSVPQVFWGALIGIALSFLFYWLVF